MNFKKAYLLLTLVCFQLSFSQEGIAVYSDYLADNYYLIHPSMAGAANCSKLRLTARQQWFGQSDAPSLQTLSYNGKIGDKSGGGIILYNDRNGFHSQKGLKLTYAHHILFSRDDVDLNQLSFGMSAGLVQSALDESSFTGPGQPSDPNIQGTVVQKYAYFNVDVGMSYNYLEFYAHLTVKNAIETRRKIYSDFENDNIRKVILNAGYVIGNNDNFLWEPSFMFQIANATKEKSVDFNLKVYKQLDIGKLWGGLSYRRGIEGAQYIKNGTVNNQKLQYITPIVGFNYNNLMFSYTYSYLSGAIRFDNGGYHQITLGMNLFCKREKYDCHCPAIN